MNYNTREITSKSIWENFIKKNISSQNFNASHIQSWAWGDFLIKLNQKIYRLGFYKNDKLEAIALGTKVHAKRGRYLHFRHGPVYSWENKNFSKYIIESLKSLAKNEGVWFVRISPLIKQNRFSQLNLQTLNSQMHSIDAEETWVINLVGETEKSLLSKMRKNTRYMIKKATKCSDLKIIKSANYEDLKYFFPIYDDTVKRHKWTAYTHDYIQTQFKIFAKESLAKLYLAKYNDKFIAGAIFISYANQKVYQHSGSLTQFRKIPASYLIQWEAIKDALKEGINKYNLWGVPLNSKNELKLNDPWSGLGLFKVGFGGEAERWIHAQDIPVNYKYWLTHFYEKYETLKRNLLKHSK